MDRNRSVVYTRSKLEDPDPPMMTYSKKVLY